MKLLGITSDLRGDARVHILLALAIAHGSIGVAATPPSTHYEVSIEPSGVATVQVCVRRQQQRLVFSVDRFRRARVVSSVERNGAGALDAHETTWNADDWTVHDCLSYRADIAVLADSQSDAGSRHGDTFSADPSYWLLQPDVPDQAGYSITVHLPERWGLSAPWRDVVRNGDSISAFIPATPREWSASVVFGELEEHRIGLPGGLLRVAYIGASPDAQTAAMLERCIRTAAESVASVAGRLPVPEVRVLILPVSKLSLAFRFAAWLDGGAVLGGESARGQGNSLELVVDPRRPESEFRRDWTTFHELSHLLHPYLGDRGAWLTEGLATYYQTVLRVRAGRMTQSEAWQRMIEGLAGC